jgi:hypothetical protein
MFERWWVRLVLEVKNLEGQKPRVEGATCLRHLGDLFDHFTIGSNLTSNCKP